MSRPQLRTNQEEASELLRRINNVRSSAKLNQLTLNGNLQKHAEQYASFLAQAKALSPSCALLKVPYGENLHHSRTTCAATDAFLAWNKKKCARDNIYTSHAKYVGVGVVLRDSQAFTVMLLTKHDPDQVAAEDLGSIGSCTTKGSLLQTETDVVTRTEWPVEKEATEKENANPEEKERLPVAKALDIAHDAFNYMNGARRDAGVHYLRWDDGLYKQAFAHSERIFRLGRLLHSGNRRFENVAVIEVGSIKKPGKLLAEKLMRRRENMLSSSFEYCAIAVVGSGDKVYATQLFSRERVE